jgi:hypothetical protein
MRMLIAATLALSTFAGSAALAQRSHDDRTTATPNGQTQACYDEARRQALKGEALSDFMAYCTAEQLAQTPPAEADVWKHCDEQTSTLQGEEKQDVMRDCAARW